MTRPRREPLDPLRLQPRSLTTPREEPLEAHLRQWTSTPDSWERSMPGGRTVEVALRGGEAAAVRVDRGPWRVLSPRVDAGSAFGAINGVGAVLTSNTPEVWAVVAALGDASGAALSDASPKYSRDAGRGGAP